MSWTFFPEGLIMPAAIPGGEIWDGIKAENPEIPVDAPVEDYLQVRGRVESHLQNFYNAYMEDRVITKIHATPEMDYNFRFYALKQDVAFAYALSIMKIDYLKFKPKAFDHDEKFSPYYNLLNKLWGSITALGEPGGIWGKASSYRGWSGKYKGSGKKVGSSFYEGYGDSTDPSKPNNVYGVYNWDDEPMWAHGETTGSDMDWAPNKDEEIELVLESLEGIPRSQWQEMCTPHEWELIEPIYDADIQIQFESADYDTTEADARFNVALEAYREVQRRENNRREASEKFKKSKKNRRRTREQYKNSRARQYNR